MGPSVEYLSSGVDDAGRVFTIDDEIYRALTVKGKRLFDYITQNGVYENLVDGGLVPSKMTDMSLENYAGVVKHKKIEFISYSQEWPLEMLKQAALLQCRLTRALVPIGLATKDAHPWNITFDFSQPVFLDLGSIVFLQDMCIAPWIREFRTQFYVPLWLAAHKYLKLSRLCATANPHSLIKEITSHRIVSKIYITFNRLSACATRRGFSYFLDSLIEHLESLNVSPSNKANSDCCLPGWKKELIREILRSINGTSLIDIRASQGAYSTLAADLGLKVVAIDVDAYSIEYLYKQTRLDQRTVLPLVIDFLRPTPPFGIGLFYKNSYERLRCDIGLALDVVYHLVFKAGVNFETIATIIGGYVRHFLLIEFIPPANENVSKCLQGHEEKYAWYSEDHFLSAFLKQFRSFKSWGSPDDNRKLYLFER